MRTGMKHTLPYRWRLAVAVAVGGQLLFAGASIAEEDHLKGYKIKDLNQVPPPANPYTVTNEFGSESCELKKPQFFLVQSEKNLGDDGRGGEPGNFVCYKAKCTGTVPPPTAQDSQFGLHNLETKKAKLVCLPVDPPPPPCAGDLVGGFCWFLGNSGDSCDTTCGAQTLTCSPATVAYAGTSGTLVNCDAVLDAISAPDTAIDGSLTGGIGTGCGRYGIATHYRELSAPTTCAAAQGSVARACACQ